MKTILHKKNYFRLILFLFFILCFAILFFIFFRANKSQSDLTDENEIINELKECIRVKVDKNCYENISDKILKYYSYEDALSIVKKYQDLPEIKDCHEFAHYVGKKVFRETNDLKSVLISPNVNLCLQGFLHGAIIENFTRMDVLTMDKNNPRIRELFVNICGTKDSFNFVGHFVECFHALGHASMIMTGNNLPSSLEICDLLEKEQYQESCYSGALMENFNDTQSAPVAKVFFDKGDYNYPCYELNVKYSKLCYRWKGEYFFGLNKNNFESSLVMCQKIKGEFVNECVLRLARSYARNNYYKRDEVLGKCMSLSDRSQGNYCLRGVIELIISDVNDPKILEDYCDNSKEIIDYCYDVVFGSIDLWASDTLAETQRSCEFILNIFYRDKCVLVVGKKFL